MLAKVLCVVLLCTLTVQARRVDYPSDVEEYLRRLLDATPPFNPPADDGAGGRNDDGGPDGSPLERILAALEHLGDGQRRLATMDETILEALVSLKEDLEGMFEATEGAGEETNGEAGQETNETNGEASGETGQEDSDTTEAPPEPITEAPEPTTEEPEPTTEEPERRLSDMLQKLEEKALAKRLVDLLKEQKA